MLLLPDPERSGLNVVTTGSTRNAIGRLQELNVVHPWECGIISWSTTKAKGAITPRRYWISMRARCWFTLARSKGGFRFCSRLKHLRRAATRYDEVATNFVIMARLA